MYSVQIAVSDGTLTRISLSIEYFEKDDITLYRNLGLTPLVLGVDWQWDGDTAINVLTGVPVPASEYIIVRRNTNIDRAFNIYDGGAAFSRDTLDENFKQMIYLAQEFTEGNGLTGLYFPLDMHGFKITNLGNGTAPKDAINKGQLDVVDNRVIALEQTYITSTTSYPWYELTDTIKDTFTPGINFTKAAVFINGVCQVPGYSYNVISNQLVLAETVPAGTMVFARLGEDVGNDPGYVTSAQFSSYVTSNNTAVSGKASKGANSDITSLSGLTTPLSTSQGGTGNATGNTSTATALQTARSVQVNLGSLSSASFNGTADIAPGVSGILTLGSGGTGAVSAPAARTNLGSTTVGDAVFVAVNAAAGRTALLAAASGSNADITALTTLSGGITGLITGTAAGVGIVGEVLGDTANGSTVALSTNTAANIHSLVLTAGDWYVEGAVQLVATGLTSTARTYSISTVSAVLSANWWDNEADVLPTTALTGTINHDTPARLIRVSSSTTVYMVVSITFSAGTVTGRGYLRARRAR